MTANNINVEIFLFNPFLFREAFNIQPKVVVYAYSVKRAWLRHDGVLLRQGQHFNPVLLFMVTLAGRA